MPNACKVWVCPTLTCGAVGLMAIDWRTGFGKNPRHPAPKAIISNPAKARVNGSLRPLNIRSRPRIAIILAECPALAPFPVVHGLGHPRRALKGSCGDGALPGPSEAEPRYHTTARILGTTLRPKLAECFTGVLRLALSAKPRFFASLRMTNYDDKLL